MAARSAGRGFRRNGVGGRRRGYPKVAIAAALAAAAGGLAAWGMPGAPARALGAPARVLGAPAGARLAASMQVAAKGRPTRITVDGKRPGAAFSGIGAISGGGGNSRYLIDYPEPERSQILDYLFTPDYGASLQMLKLEIGGDGNSSDGAEPSVEHTKGAINCNAGYEWWIAEQAVQRNPAIKLYALQWTAPGWVGDRAGNLWTRKDVNYVIGWLNCARSHGLTISYLGGRDEAGYNAGWYEHMRAALDKHGYRQVQLVAADGGGNSALQLAKTLATNKKFDRAVSIVGDHYMCGHLEYDCTATKSAWKLHKPLWLAEQGGLNPNTQADAVERAINLMYVQGRMTGMLEWPLLNSEPPGLPFESKGLITADQPWSGNYAVTKAIWATAQTTQFTGPGWVYVHGADGKVGNSGSYDTYMAPDHSNWSMVAENTGSREGQKVKARRIKVTVKGGLSRRTVHVWATNLETMNSSQWFVREPDVALSHGKFSYTIPAGYVVTFTTTTGQSKAGGNPPAVPASGHLPLPYYNTLAAGDGSDEAQYLATLDGAFGLTACLNPPPHEPTTCLQQMTPQTPVLWHAKQHLDYPYAVIGDSSWSNYTVTVNVLLTQTDGTAGVIGRFTKRASRTTTPPMGNRVGLFEGYMFDVSENGDWKILKNTVTRTTPAVLASGRVAALGVDTWHTLSLTMNGHMITAVIDGRPVGSARDKAYTSGLAGIEAGAFTKTWPIDQYSRLSVTPAG